MEAFRDLFGVAPSLIRETCVLFPFSRRSLLAPFGVEKLQRGLLYSAADAGFCSLVLTRVGALFAGDAVLHLADTPCREIIFLGTCGLIPPVSPRGIGSLVCPGAWFGKESFSELAAGDLSFGPRVWPDPELRRCLLAAAGLADDPGPAGVSFGSLYLQPELLPRWRGKGVEAVDLESAAVLAAAGRIGRRAVSLLVAGDIVGVRPFYCRLSPEEESALQLGLDRAAGSVCHYIKEKSNG